MRDEPRNPADDSAPDDLILPEDLGTEMPEVSADFVDTTEARVVADRRETADDAMSNDFLQRYQVPAISEGFVDRVAASVAAAREIDGDSVVVDRALGQHASPPISRDFVQRTLDALRVERSGLEIVRGPAPVATTRRSRLPLALAAAAAVVAALLFFTRPDGAGEGSFVASERFTPAPVNTQYAAHVTRAQGGVRFASPDPVLLYAQAARERRSE